jgi:hypothetical protein
MARGRARSGLPRHPVSGLGSPDLTLLYDSLHHHGGVTATPVDARDGETWMRIDTPTAELWGMHNGTAVLLAASTGDGAIPAAHAPTHYDGGTDPLTLANLVGDLPWERVSETMNVVEQGDNVEFGVAFIADLRADTLQFGAAAWSGGNGPIITDIPPGSAVVPNLNAEFLGGQNSAYHRARTNHTGTQGWATLTGTPTTLAGYGISDAAASVHDHAAVDVSSGNLAYARLPTGSGSWDVGSGNVLTLPRGVAASAGIGVFGSPVAGFGVAHLTNHMLFRPASGGSSIQFQNSSSVERFRIFVEEPSGYVGFAGQAGFDLRFQNVRSGTSTVVLVTKDSTLNVGIRTATEFGGGAGVVGIANALALPGSAVSGGGVLHADAGALKWKGSSSTVTTMGPAEPHCPTCGRDFALGEWENEGGVYPAGYLALCGWCVAEVLRDSFGGKGIIAMQDFSRPDHPRGLMLTTMFNELEVSLGA